MQIICIAFWIGFYLNMHVKAMKTVDYDLIYFLTGESLTLSCNFKVSFWNGPAVTDMDNMTSPVTITDMSGNLKVLNVSIYMHGGTLASTLPKKRLNRLKIVGDNFDLRITNLSTFDEGLYICEPKEKRGLPPSQYYLQNILFPSELNILNVTPVNTVIGKEHTRMHLVCSVKSGKPLEELRWKKNKTIIKQGGPGKLVYSFVPKTTDHNSVYTCEAQNSCMAIPLSKSIHLNIKYKPIVHINISSTLTVIQGEFAHMCCISMSNPKPTSISWYKADKELPSAFSNNSLCYKMNKVSRYETGNYTCSSQNEIGNASSEISLVVLYPPVIKVLYRNLTAHSRNRNIQCLPKGEPKSYKFLMWEHTSLFNEHIRYLDGTGDGILRIPEINISNIYQDTGFYICNVSNGIPDYAGNIFQQGRAYYLASIGLPVFASSNELITEKNKEVAVDIKVKVFSSSEIICHKITEVGYPSDRQHDIAVSMKPILIKKSFHDVIVTVNAIEITFVLSGLKSFGCRKFNVTVCNRYGQSSVYIDLQQYVSYLSEEKTVSFKVIIIIALLIIIGIFVVGTGIYFRYMKRRCKQRVLTAVNIQTSERNGEESAHYADIIEDDNIPSQGNNTSFISTADRIVAVNRNLIHVSGENSSTSSENDTHAAEYLDDGYEKPYTILMENIEAEDTHTYLITQETPQYRELSHSVHAACGHFVEFIEQASSMDETKMIPSEHDDQKNIQLKYVENYETDDDSPQLKVYTKKKTVEYVNLSLKQ